MNVLYDHSMFVQQQYGGVSRYFAELIPRVAGTDGIQAEVYLGLFVNLYGVEKCRKRFNRFGGLQRPAIPRTARLALRVSDWLFARFAARTRAAVYHTTADSLLLPNYRGKRVVTVHDMTPELFPVLFPTEQGRARTFLQADRIICVSHATKRDLQRILGIPDDRIAVIHHGNSLEGVTPGRRVIPQPYILHVGAHWSYKNFEALLEVFGSSGDLAREYHLACFGISKLSAREEELAGRLGIQDRIHVFRGSDALLASLYQHASVLVYPSLYEGFGMPLVEAMGLGCPVLASNTSSLPEVGGDAALYFEPTDHDDLRRQLRRLLGDSSLRASLIDAGRKRAQHFSWDRCARETVAFYQR